MKPLLLLGHQRPMTKVMFNFTGDILFTSCKAGTLCAWNPDDGTLLQRYQLVVDETVVERAIWDFDLTLDGEYLIVATAGGIFMFNVKSGKQMHRHDLDAVCRAIEWNKKPDLQNKFVASRDSFQGISMAILIFQLTVPSISSDKFCNQILEITDFSSNCVGVSWGPYDESLISWHEDGTMYLWDTKTGQKIIEKKHFGKRVTKVDFNRNRTLCLCASFDKTAKLLHTLDLEIVQTYYTDRPLNACSLSPLMNSDDESQKRLHILVAGGQSAEEVTTTKTHEGKCEAILMHLVTAEILGFISGHFSPINSITFMRDGSGFVTGAEEGNVRVCKFDTSYFTNPKYV